MSRRRPARRWLFRLQTEMAFNQNDFMKNRWIWFSICAVMGLAMLICGLLVPAHLRVVDASVIGMAGSNTPGLVERGLALVSRRNLGAAQLLLEAAQAEALSDREQLGLAFTNLAKADPRWLVWGGGDPRMERFFESDSQLPKSGSEPFTEFVVRLENREVLLEFLRASPQPVTKELLRCRELTNTVVFPPSQSASGQAFDAALSICGLLLEEGHLTAGLSNAVFALAAEANRGGNSQPLEQVLMDLMSLGQRFNYGQLVAFVGGIEDAGTLRLLSNQVRQASGQLPALFSAVLLSDKPADVAKYLGTYSETGLKDLASSLRSGAGGVNELLQRNQRLHSSSLRRRLTAYNPFRAFFQFSLGCCMRLPWLALAMKWLFYLSAGFLIATAVHFARPAVSALEQPLQVRGFHAARGILFALGFLLVVLFLSEPFLSQESQKVAYPFRLRLPTAGSVVPVGTTRANQSIMNEPIILTLLLFFVLQALIYTACLVKLAEIHRQKVPPRMKLKLLENEDHLFDAGLYLGFVGTIVSLILVSMGVIQFSLMAAYSSTSFGIVFVCVFKIFHLRPARRKLLLEAEAASAELAAPAAARTLAPPL
jgi:hypothetical protein